MGFGSVRLTRWHVADDLTVIQSYPIEGSMRKIVDVVPTKLLSQKPRHARNTANLGELGRVAERVWEPEGLAALPEAALEVPLSVQELPDQGLATGEIGIVLYPASANGLERALLDLLLYTVKCRRVQLFQPLVLLGLGADKAKFGITIDEIALVRPGARHFTLRLGEWPQPARIDVTIAHTGDDGLVVALVDLVGIYVAQELARNLAALSDALVAPIARNESVYDAICDLLRLMLLDRVIRELTSCIVNLPEVVAQGPGLEVDGLDLDNAQTEGPVRVRGLDRATVAIAEHAIAGHLNVEGVPFSVSEFLGQDPLCAFAAAGQAVHDVTVLSPYHALAIGIPHELEMLLVAEIVGHSELYLDPVCGPAWSEPVARHDGAEVMRYGIFEGGTREVGCRPTGELDRTRMHCFSINDLTTQRQ